MPADAPPARPASRPRPRPGTSPAARCAPDPGRWVGGIVRESVPEPVKLACWARMSRRMADWAIREVTAADVTTWLRVAAGVSGENGLVPPSSR